jgi:hypothetical protein
MINFNTKLDLERQSKILSGHTAVFDGGVSFGIPFSGFPSGVDTGTTVLTSYNVITGETSGYSGTTGTTFFGITPVNPSAFTDSRIISGTTGLTSVITGTTSNYVQTYGPIWDLTSSTIIDEHLVGLSYSGFQITYTFNNVSASTPTTFDAYVNARVDYYSANTLDYKGSTNWLTIRGNATVDERLTVNRLTVTSGATVGYVLTCSDSGGTVEWQSGSSGSSLWVEDGSGNTAIKDTHGTHSITGTSDYSIIGGGSNNSIYNSINSGIFAGSGNVIASHNRSVILGGQNISTTLNDYVYAPNMIISTGGTTSKLGINTTPTHVIHAVGNKSSFYMEDSYTSGYFIDFRQMLFVGDSDTASAYVITDGVVDIGIGVRGTSTSDTSAMLGLGVVGDTFINASAAANGLNIMNYAGSGTEDFIRFYAGQYPYTANTADLHIQGSGTTRGYVGIGTEIPTEILTVNGNVTISGSLTKGSGTFRIPNPTPNKDNYLYHSFVESPNAGDNIYRWSIEIINGIGVIELPDYYNYLNENNQIWVNPVEHFGIGYGKIIENSLEIHCNIDGKYNVLLIGTRKDEIATNNWKGVERNK